MELIKRWRRFRNHLLPLTILSALPLLSAQVDASMEEFHWTHQINLEEGVQFKWSTLDAEFMTGEISVPVQGYVAMGFSRKLGLIEGSDVLLAWVSIDGVPKIQDSFVDEDGSILPDEQKDYQLISASTAENETRMRFRREWTTCDPEQDVAIGNDTTRVFWSYGSSPLPESGSEPQGFILSSSNFTGGRSIYMRLPPNVRPDSFPDVATFDANITHWDLTMNNVFISSKANTFMCKLFKLPEPEATINIVGFRPLLTPGTEDFLHKMVVYSCLTSQPTKTVDSPNFEQVLQIEKHCYKSTTPAELSYCKKILIAWGVGSHGEMFPDHVGMPVGGREEGYIKLEIQYFNRERIPFSDSSGLRLFYTSSVRDCEAATLSLGHRATPFQLIPHGQDYFISYSVCPQDCTANSIKSSTGMRILSIMLDAHSSAVAITIRHIRDGRELEPLIQEMNFDPEYHQYRILKADKVILPRDELLVECAYNTLDKDRIIFGGPEYNQELCQALLMYYPRTPLTDCRSQPEMYSFLKPLGIGDAAGYLLHSVLNVPSSQNSNTLKKSRSDSQVLDDSFKLMITEIGPIEVPFDFVQITSPSSYAHHSLGEHMRHLPWYDMKFSRQIQSSWREGGHAYVCQGSSFEQQDRLTRYPRFRRYHSRNTAKSLCIKRNRTFKKSSADFRTSRERSGAMGWGSRQGARNHSPGESKGICYLMAIFWIIHL